MIELLNAQITMKSISWLKPQVRLNGLNILDRELIIWRYDGGWQGFNRCL